MAPDNCSNIEHDKSIEAIVKNVTNSFLENPHLKETEHINWDLQQILAICELAKEVLERDSSNALLRLGSAHDHEQWSIFGDLHGQYNEMISLLKKFSRDWMGIQNSKTYMKYLFLGDYVDRGNHSLEVIMSLLIWKIRCPDQVYLLRGNHECLSVNQRYGFKKECQKVFGLCDGIRAWKAINQVFEYFPLAAIIQGEYFCVHGGLCEQLITVEQIEEIQLPYRLQEGTNCLGNNMLWSDPDVNNKVEDYTFNPKRGPIFGHNAVDDFFAMNKGLKKIIRAHQTAEEGFWTVFDARVVTVFSAPNYRGICNNWAGIMIIRQYEPDCILQFEKTEYGTVESKTMTEI